MICKSKLVGDAQHCHALIGKLPHGFKHLSDQFGIKSRSDFVKQHDFRVHGKRSRYRNALFLPTGQSRRTFFRLFSQAHASKLRHCLLRSLRFAASEHRNLTFNYIFKNDHVRKQIEMPKNHSDARTQSAKFLLATCHTAATLGADQFPLEIYAAPGWRFHEIHAAKQGLLAGSRRTQNNHGLSRLDAEANAFQHFKIVKALVQVFYPYNPGHQSAFLNIRSNT